MMLGYKTTTFDETDNNLKLEKSPLSHRRIRIFFFGFTTRVVLQLPYRRVASTFQLCGI